MDANKEIKLKQLRFRSGHRGFNEMDQLLKAFCESHLDKLDDALLTQYEQLLDLPDLDTYSWLIGQAEPPPDAPKDIISYIRKIIAA